MSRRNESTETAATSTSLSPVSAPARRAGLDPGASASKADAPLLDVGENAPENAPCEAGAVGVCESACESARDSVPPSTETPADGRSASGQFVRGNRCGEATRFGVGRDPATQLVHGLRSARWRVALVEHYAEAVAAKREALVADKGGADAISTVLGDAFSRYLECDLMLATLAGRLQTEGVFTSRGRVRSAFGAYLSLLDRWRQLAALIGVARQPKPSLDLGEYLASRYGQQRNGPGEAATLTQDASSTQAEV